MKTPKVSVIMPAYNSEKYIGEAIESILNQTFTDFELIVLNDSPNNKKLENIVKTYVKKDKRVKYIKNSKNLGVAKSRNILLQKCRGEFVACMDSDDVSLPTRFEKQIKYMKKHPECGVLGTWFQLFEKDTTIIQHPERIKIFNILKNQHVGNPTVMMRKSLFDKYDIKYDINYNYCEDFELWSRLIFITEIHNLPEILLRYRWHGTNVSIEHQKHQLDLANCVKQNILNKLTTDKTEQQAILHKPKQGILLPKWLGKICCLFIFKHKNRVCFRNKYVKD